MQCPHCGKRWPDALAEEFEVCPKCGGPLKGTVAPDTLTARDIHAQNVVVGTQITPITPNSDPATLRRAYLQTLARTANRLPWTNVVQDHADPNSGTGLGLAEVYTQLDTTALEQVTCEEELRDFMAGVARGEAQRISAQATLEREKRLLILGDPGSGKSTVLNYVAYVLAQAGLSENTEEWLARLDPWTHGTLLPVRVALRGFAAWAEDHPRTSNVIAYLKAALTGWALQDAWSMLRDALRGAAPVLVLFDGLDEVPTAQRETVVRAVQAFSDHYTQHRVVVTCRPYAYVGQPWPLQGFTEVTLAPFNAEQQDTFIATWYAELAKQDRLSEGEAHARAQQLQSAIRRQDLAGLARRPLLLTVMALLHSFRGTLPEDRTELYADAVDLLLRRWEQRISEEAGLIAQLDIPGLKISDLEAGLYDVAFRANQLAGEDHGTADIDEGDLRKWLAPYLGGSWDKAGEFVGYIRERAGLLVRHKTEAYTFPHRTFQEFMAACHLVGMPDYVNEAARLVRKDLVRWREVFVLAAGHATRTHRLGQAIAAVNALVPRAITEVKAPTSKAYLEAELAGDALREIGLVGVHRQEAGRAVLARIQKWLAAGMRADAALKPRQRADLGNVLAPLGDPRFRADAWSLPDEPLLGFVEIPAGPFVMGSDPQQDEQASDREQPQHERELSPYYIARYPVTVAQFRAFVQASEYKPDTERCLEGVDNHPVVYVTWHDAVAYCRWLTARLQVWQHTPEPLATLLREKDWVITLPSEAQWEKAARGPLEGRNPGRIFPWGNKPDPNRANYGRTIGQRSAVGCFPGGVSPYGIEDLGGNVLEWTRTQWQENYEGYQPDLPVDDRAVLRGGAFSSLEGPVRCASRYRYFPYLRYDYVGFRVVCGVPHPSGL